MNYEEMSDFEINKSVAEKHLSLFADVAKSKGKLDSDVWLIDTEGMLRWTNYNPCHNPKHAWPIVVENKISLTTEGNSYWNADRLTMIESENENESFTAHTGTGFIQDKNPLRAAMICFLKMKDSQHD